MGFLRKLVRLMASKSPIPAVARLLYFYSALPILAYYGAVASFSQAANPSNFLRWQLSLTRELRN